MNKILIGIFLIIMAVLLVSARFGFVFAGGSGYVKTLSASIEIADGEVKIDRAGKTKTAGAGDSISRGEKISTGENSRVLIRIEKNIIIALDQQTDIIFEQLLPSQVEIKIIRGRLLANASPETAELIVSSPKAIGKIFEGSITVVRYDFLDKTTYASMKGKVFVDLIENPLSFRVGDQQAVNIDEINPLQSDFSEFNSQTGSTVDFYKWAELNLATGAAWASGAPEATVEVGAGEAGKALEAGHFDSLDSLKAGEVTSD